MKNKNKINDALPYRRPDRLMDEVPDVFSIHPATFTPSAADTGYSFRNTFLRLNGSFRIALILIGLGNLLIHLYCQNWHWVDPLRPHTAPFFLVICFAIVLIREELLKLLRSPLDPFLVVLPSVIGGIMALIAFLAGLPGLEGWIPVSRSGASILGDMELLLLPLITIGQLLMLARSTRGGG